MAICLIKIGNIRDAPSSINKISLIWVTLTRDHTIYILYCRCQNVMSAKKQHLIDPAIDQGKWYEMKQSAKRQKLTVDASTSSLPPPAPHSGWKTFPDSDIPKMFNEGHIYHHLVESLQGPAVDELDEDDSAPHLDSTPLSHYAGVNSFLRVAMLHVWVITVHRHIIMSRQKSLPAWSRSHIMCRLPWVYTVVLF